MWDPPSRGGGLDETQYTHFSQQWEHREHMNRITSYLGHVELKVNSWVPAMGIEEMPGLAQGSQPSPISTLDLEQVAQEMCKHHVEVHYIRGFVQTGDLMSTMNVEELKKQVLEGYASTVFLWQDHMQPSKKGSIWWG